MGLSYPRYPKHSSGSTSNQIAAQATVKVDAAVASRRDERSTAGCASLSDGTSERKIDILSSIDGFQRICTSLASMTRRTSKRRDRMTAGGLRCPMR